MGLFKPQSDLMKQLSELDKTNAKQWYEEYLKYHNGVDQGVIYMLGYFPTSKAKMLRKEFNIK